jgi:hypothetical protein
MRHQMRYSYFFPHCLMDEKNKLQNTLIKEGKEMTSLLYTYRSCVKALPQVSLNQLSLSTDCCIMPL